MVLLLGRKVFLSKNTFGKTEKKQIQKQTEIQPDEIRTTQPDPALTKITEDTSVEDLGTLSGEGFSVKGGRMKSKNDKLRKFISLKLQ
jgi:hypothetical protein